MNLFTSRRGLWRRVNGTLFAKFVNNVYKKLLCTNLWLHRKILRSLSCLFLSKVNHSLYQFPPRCGSILGAYWYTNVGNACPFLFGWLYQVWDCFGTSLFHFWVSVFLFHFWYRKCTKINPKVVHSLPRKISTQTWYNPWLILRPKVVHYLTKKTGGLSAARSFFILNKIIYFFSWTLSDSCHRIYDLKFCVPLLDICRHKDRHYSGKDCHTKACVEQTLHILCCQYSHKNHSDRNGCCKKNL